MHFNEKLNRNKEQIPSREELKVVEKIEKLETTDRARRLIILTWKGLKPVSEFDLETSKYDDINDPKSLESQEKAESLFKELGLFYHRIDESYEGNRYKDGKPIPMIFHGNKYYIAKNEEDLKFMVNHFGQVESQDTTEKLGTILGYPNSAIEAWNSENRKESILAWDAEPSPYTQEEAAFTEFRFSKENWQQEFETVKKWAQEIKRLDPALYKRVVENYQRVQARKQDKK